MRELESGFRMADIAKHVSAGDPVGALIRFPEVRA